MVKKKKTTRRVIRNPLASKRAMSGVVISTDRRELFAYLVAARKRNPHATVSELIADLVS